MDCTCESCQTWRADDPNPAQATSGYCGNPRSEKAGDRTAGCDSCRHWSRCFNQEASNFQVGDRVEFLWAPNQPEGRDNLWHPGSIYWVWADGETVTIIQTGPTRHYDRPIQYVRHRAK